MGQSAEGRIGVQQTKHPPIGSAAAAWSSEQSSLHGGWRWGEGVRLRGGWGGGGTSRSTVSPVN